MRSYIIQSWWEGQTSPEDTVLDAVTAEEICISHSAEGYTCSIYATPRQKSMTQPWPLPSPEPQLIDSTALMSLKYNYFPIAVTSLAQFFPDDSNSLQINSLSLVVSFRLLSPWNSEVTLPRDKSEYVTSHSKPLLGFLQPLNKAQMPQRGIQYKALHLLASTLLPHTLFFLTYFLPQPLAIMNNLRFPRCPVTSRWLPTPPPLLSMPVPSFLCVSSGFNSDPSTKLGVIVMYTHRYPRTVPGTESTTNVVAVLNTAIITLSPGFSTLTLLTLNYRYVILWCGSSPVNCRMLNGISGLYSAGCQWHPPTPCQGVTVTNISGHSLMSPGGQNWPGWESLHVHWMVCHQIPSPQAACPWRLRFTLRP